MKSCWNFVPEDRLSFAVLVQQLQPTKQHTPTTLQSNRISEYLEMF